MSDFAHPAGKVRSGVRRASKWHRTADNTANRTLNFNCFELCGPSSRERTAYAAPRASAFGRSRDGSAQTATRKLLHYGRYAAQILER